jgi:predicted permease
MEQFMMIGSQLIKFVFLIALGLLCSKFKVLDQTSLAGLSRLVLRVLMPFLIFTNTVTTATRQGLAESLIVLPISVLTYGLLWCVAALIVWLFHLRGNRAKVFRALTMFGNVGFVGIPLISALWPQNGMLYVALVSIVDLGLFWTLGVYYTMPVGQTGKIFTRETLKKMLSPALISILVSIVGVLCGLKLPGVVEDVCQAVSAATLPMSLIYIGGLLYFTDLRPVLRSGALYAEIVAKMIAAPLLVYIILKLLGMPPELCGTMAVLVGLPAISSVAMLSYQHGSDGDYAIGAIMLTTIACVVSLPLVSLGMSLIG